MIKDEFLEWTELDHLRHSKFAGLREDKNPRSVTKEHPGEGRGYCWEFSSHKLQLCSSVTKQHLAFLSQKTAGNRNAVIAFLKNEFARDKTGTPLALFRTMLAAISGNVLLGNAVNNRANSGPHAGTGAHGTGLMRRVKDEIRQVAAISAGYVFERFQLHVLDA
jgi:hypothetical protein